MAVSSVFGVVAGVVIEVVIGGVALDVLFVTSVEAPKMGMIASSDLGEGMSLCLPILTAMNATKQKRKMLSNARMLFMYW